MASEKAPVKLTGGGGFGFADRVGAFFLAQMLSGGFALGIRHGTITKIHFEARDSGWLLDDLLLELSAPDGRCHCAISLKSNAQVTQSGFPDSFTSTIWEQMRQTAPQVFNRDRDLLALGVGGLAAGVTVAWDQLLAQALEAEPARLLERLKEEGQSSETQRAIFGSLHCPTSICPGGPTELETAQLLRSVRLISWDFESDSSKDEERAIEICRSVLAREETEKAVSLWTELQKIAADARATGASYDLPGLLNKLRGHYELKHHPDFRPDWQTIDSLSKDSRSAIKQEIGHDVRIPREKIRKALDEKLAKESILALIGEPGCGKSSLVASLTEVNPAAPVMWLDHSQFDHPNHTALAHSLNLRVPLPGLILNSGFSNGLIVLDSIEKFSTQARRLAAELINLINQTPQGTWRALITCQTHLWESALRELVDAGVRPKQIASLEITPPEPYAAVEAISRLAPRIAPLLSRPELQRVLCNLKVLDWLVTEDTLRVDAESYSFVGETDVVTWIWNRWIGTGSSRHARAAVLMRLGEHDGNSLAAAVNILDLSDDERRTLGELETDDLVRVRQNRASFKHDLLGDWARLQSLLALGPDAIARILQIAHFPRWQRAVRLYAQHILEHEDGAKRWKAILVSFQSQDANQLLATDSFLDALIFAANAETLLEQAWPDLVLDNGHLLRRFLKRFLSIATVPDPRAAVVAEADELDWLSIKLRIPFVWYWYAPVRVLERHHADVTRLTLVLAAELCELWLRTIPPEWGGRAEAARLAIRLAREVQGQTAEEVWFRDNADQKVYEALCQAAPDYPNEVSQILLELCHRRDVSPEVTARATAYTETRRAEIAERMKAMSPEELERRRSLSPITGPWNRGERRAPAPDGPRARVPESFQVALLNTGALIPVINARPSIARELLLAVCIDEPTSEEYADMGLNHFGITNWPGGHPPMYFRGLFLRFLKSQPEEAIETITRLVGHATTRWQERYLRNAPPDLNPDAYSLELSLPNGPARWIGNFHVFCWYRDINVGANAVVSALMALEKWLYEAVDEGRDTNPWLEKILSSSTSVAFAGLLTAVGIRTPELLKGPLRPLLTSWRVLDWQQHLAPQDEVWRIGMIAWTRAGQRIYNQVVEWHTIPHRRVLLRDVAIQLLLSDQSTRDFLDEQRKAWTSKEDKPNESLELLAARFNPENYSRTDLGDGRFQIEFQWPEHLREETTRKAEAAQNALRAHSFPHRCRRILNGTDQPSEPEPFWQDFQSLANWNDDSHLARKTVSAATISAAGIAVLLAFHRRWLAQYPDREEWCIARLQLLTREHRDQRGLASKEGDLDTPSSVKDTYAESFFGESAIVLLAEMDAEWVRELAALGIMSFHYTSIRSVMRLAFRQRARLKEDFGRAVNLLICCSGLRSVAESVEHTNLIGQAVLERAAGRLIKAFITKRLSVPLIPIHRIAAISRRIRLRTEARNASSWARRLHARRVNESNEREVDREHYWLDTEVLSHGFGFLGALSQASDPSDRAAMLAYHQELLSLLIKTMPKVERPHQEVEGTPYEFDRWALKLTAATIAQLPSEKEARPFWQPIMDLSPGAHYWIEHFFREWFLTGTQYAPSVKDFGERWREMIAYSFDAPTWARGSDQSVWLDDCTTELMGLGLMMDIVATEEFIPVIQHLAAQYEKWGAEWLSHPRPLSHFAHFLSRPGARGLLPSAIIWLNRGVQAMSDYGGHERDLADTLAGALRTCWRRHKESIASDPELQRHFLQLLNTLCNQLYADALALRAEVSQFISTATA